MKRRIHEACNTDRSLSNVEQKKRLDENSVLTKHTRPNTTSIRTSHLNLPTRRARYPKDDPPQYENVYPTSPERKPFQTSFRPPPSRQSPSFLIRILMLSFPISTVTPVRGPIRWSGRTETAKGKQERICHKPERGESGESGF